MGNCNFKIGEKKKEIIRKHLQTLCVIFTALSKNAFQFKYVIGKGGFGKVISYVMGVNDL